MYVKENKNKSLGIYNLIYQNKIDKSIKRVLNDKIDYNIYTSPKGLKELRQKISDFLNETQNQEISYNDIMITNGSQQSLNLIAYSLLNEGDTVLIEQPTYFGVLEVFRNRKINLIGINLQKDGLDLEDLEKKIKIYNPKIIYVTPTFNNPTGIAWSNNKRIQFLKIINRYNVLIIEDDPYYLINFTNETYESLYKLNNKKNIIYLGTFSKIISPSIKVGYIISNIEIINKMYKYKKSFDLCTSAFIQYVVLDYLKNNDIQKIINNKIKKYKEFLNLSKEQLKENNNIISFSEPKGGIYFLVKFKEKIDERIYENGNNYYIDENHENETRINICNLLK